MGFMKDLMIEERNSKFDELLANELGLSREELESVDYRIEDVMNNDGLLYGYQVVFPDNTPKEILNKVRNLRNMSAFVDLHVIEQVDEYYGEQLEAISTTKDQYDNFLREIVNIQELLKIKTANDRQKEILLRQIYVSVFATLETYLSDTFIWLVRGNTNYLRAFVETYPEFKQRKFELKDVFASYDNIKDTASKVMLDIIYHDLRKVREMYTKTFSIEFPSIKKMMGYLSIRHDLVHRNGKSKFGEVVPIDESIVNDFIHEVREFVKQISSQLPVDDGLPF